MIFTFSLVLLLIVIALFLYRPIHKFNYVLYVATLILAVSLHEGGNYITYGYVGLSFFIVVMYTGVFEKGNLRKRLIQVRAEYAVMGTIFIAPHMLGYIGFLIEDIPLSSITINYIFGLITMLIIIPLFVTSFQFVRRKLGYKLWKKIHQYAYWFYLFVGLHLISINNQRQFFYIVVFGSYGILRTVMYFQNQLKKEKLKQ